MHHFYQAITNTSGQSLVGYFARVVNTSTAATVTLAADENGTPISTVSGFANMAETDAEGNVSFYVTPGTYHLDIYAPNATSFIKRIPNVGMTSVQGDVGPVGPSGPSNNTRASLATLKAAATTDLTSLYDGKLWFWTTGDFTGRADDRMVVKADSTPLTAGAWVASVGAVLTPKLFGAVGGGLLADDTAALAKAIAAATLTGLPMVGDGSVYGIRTTGGANQSTPILPLAKGIRLRGLNLVVIPGGLYPCIIGAYPSTSTDLTGLSITDCTFDHNVMNGPALQVSGSTLLPQYSMNTIIVLTGNDVEFCGNTIKNVSATNPVYINGDPGRTSRITFNRNKLLGLGDNPAHVFHDSSGCYLVGDFIECCDNTVEAASWTAKAAIAGLEIHPGKFADVRGNTISGTRDGINFYGVTDNGGGTGDTENSLVSDNSIDVRAIGILLGSGTLGSHTGGYGLRNVTVAANSIRIRQMLNNDAAQYVFGVAISSGASLPIKGLTIRDTRVEFDDETGSGFNYHPTANIGIGINEASTNQVYEDVRVLNCEVVNAPATAFGFGSGNGTFKNCSGHNLRAVRPGSGTLAGTTAALKRGVVVAPNTITGGFTITGLDIVDDRATTRMTRAVTISASVAVAAPVTITGSVTVSGSTTAAFAYLIEKANTNITPFIDVTQIGLGGIANSPGATFKLGSQVTDRANGVAYVMLTDGGSAFSARPVFAQGAAQADSTATTIAGLVSDFNGLLAKLRAAKLVAP
ncbi:MAG: hypothetical protein ACOYBT_09895 [Polynucleobacter sp.]